MYAAASASFPPPAYQSKRDSQSDTTLTRRNFEMLSTLDTYSQDPVDSFDEDSYESDG